ncbi:MAG: hypothetical protein QHJ82_17515, partial [Verrucomicrobiota bacterium]|nr:hypothetical protein [Verrucomicrobiota bacterium]
ICLAGVADGPGGARAGGVARQATLVQAGPGLEICKPSLLLVSDGVLTEQPIYKLPVWVRKFIVADFMWQHPGDC